MVRAAAIPSRHRASARRRRRSIDAAPGGAKPLAARLRGLAPGLARTRGERRRDPLGRGRARRARSSARLDVAPPGDRRRSGRRLRLLARWLYRGAGRCHGLPHSRRRLGRHSVGSRGADPPGVFALVAPQPATGADGGAKEGHGSGATSTEERRLRDCSATPLGDQRDRGHYRTVMDGQGALRRGTRSEGVLALARDWTRRVCEGSAVPRPTGVVLREGSVIARVAAARGRQRAFACETVSSSTLMEYGASVSETGCDAATFASSTSEGAPLVYENARRAAIVPHRETSMFAWTIALGSRFSKTAVT